MILTALKEDVDLKILIFFDLNFFFLIKSILFIYTF